MYANFLLFYEYFHGDDGYGLGANHQTGWTALISELNDNAVEVKSEEAVLAF